MIVRRCFPLILLVLAAYAVAARAADLLPADKPINEVIDYYLDLKLKDAGIQPAPAAAETDLLRRVMLDLAGRIPTPAEVQAYLAASDPDKRARLVDQLLSSPEFVAHQVNELDALLMFGSSGNLRDYLGQAVAEHRSWDRIFRELLTAAGSQEAAKGAEQFLLARAKDSDRLTNDVSTIFFGVNISCTQCHDHPLVSGWKQDHFYGMKSFFNRTFDNGGFLAERDYGIVTYKTPRGEDRTGKLMFLSGTVLEEPAAQEPSNEEKKQESKQLKEWAEKKVAPPPPKVSRRARLMEVALQPGENQFFARSIVNRLWRRLLGYGLVMPVDQMHDENPPSHPELLDWLTRDLVAGGYDLQRLIRGIVLSQAYARDSRWESLQRPEPELFAVANVRPLTPQQYAAALKVATTNWQETGAKQTPEAVAERVKNVVHGSLGLAQSFEMPLENFQVSVSESLLLSNNDKMAQELLADRPNQLVGQLRLLACHQEQVQTAAWAILSRAPTTEEAALLEDYLNERADRPADGLAQMVWVLLSGAEFRFNH